VEAMFLQVVEVLMIDGSFKSQAATMVDVVVVAVEVM
jgi:hypothetical protein